MLGKCKDVLNGLHKNSGELDVRNLRAKFAAMPFLELATLGKFASPYPKSRPPILSVEDIASNTRC